MITILIAGCFLAIGVIAGVLLSLKSLREAGE